MKNTANLSNTKEQSRRTEVIRRFDMLKLLFLGRQDSGCDLFSVQSSAEETLNFMLKVPNKMDSNFNNYIYLYDALSGASLAGGKSLTSIREIAYYVEAYDPTIHLIELKCAGYYEGRRAFVSYVFGQGNAPLLLVGVNTAGKNLQDRFENAIFYGV